MVCDLRHAFRNRTFHVQHDGLIGSTEKNTPQRGREVGSAAEKRSVDTAAKFRPGEIDRGSSFGVLWIFFVPNIQSGTLTQQRRLTRVAQLVEQLGAATFDRSIDARERERR
jgi:hypothetical protein